MHCTSWRRQARPSGMVRGTARLESEVNEPTCGRTSILQFVIILAWVPITLRPSSRSIEDRFII